MSQSPKSIKVAKTKSKRKFSLCSIKTLRTLSDGEVYSYIDDLHEQFKKNIKKLQKYKEKAKFLKKKILRLNKKPKALADSDIQSVVNDATSLLEIVEVQEQKTFVDEIREAAELAQNEQGFIFEPTSGLYYDQKTGYYYNAEYGLYYDGNSGCYYKYNQENDEFVFHSQVPEQKENQDKDISHKKQKRKKEKKSSKHKKQQRKKRSSDTDSNSNDDYEDGEIMTSSSEDGDLANGTYEDVAKKYPPSLRIIVQETNLDKIKVGQLYLITFKGGTLGREGDHDVIIPDLNISKYHLQFLYNETKSVYQCVDLGSRNGTLLNTKRMSSAKQESDPFDLVHGSILQLSQTKLLCHIHAGTSTCEHCEPGLVMIEQKEPKKIIILSHKEQLKKIQKKYGLQNDKFVVSKDDINYNNRAADRRCIVGSSTDKEKTQIASVDIAISSENKGFKMLSKLGWNAGETLGKENSGLHEPIPIVSNDGKKGLGCDVSIYPTVSLTKVDIKKSNILKNTQKRYTNLTSDIFNDSDDSTG